MKRREFIMLLGGAAVAWPLVVRAQQPAMPVIGYLGVSSFETSAGRSLLAFKRGLAETGYAEDRNVTIEYRWAEDQYDRLPGLAKELVQRRVAVLVAAGSPAALPAKGATTVIPTVFMIGSDPVELGLVASLNHPGSNLTGVAYLNVEVAPKRLELLHQFVPSAKSIGLLVNPAFPVVAEAQAKELESAARTTWPAFVARECEQSNRNRGRFRNPCTRSSWGAANRRRPFVWQPRRSTCCSRDAS